MRTDQPRHRSSWRFSVGSMITYVAWLIGQVIAGSMTVARRAVIPGRFAEPSIVAFPLRCTTDLEVTWMASSITITPGTLVVGTAHGTDSEPVTVFVHSVFDADRESVHEGLREMEDRLLRMTRGPRWQDHAEGDVR
ncbi:MULTISPECIES: Na+/H+ antiporter subunit E [Citricoccus]|uniref:Na+/H+ antiporter subunit E n=1 Tax=Citricoccus TaxID=169133 RepID=UPI000255E105|nr:Na+/H+ antiporter subunit E [Citricoccus sp. CH26A]